MKYIRKNIGISAPLGFASVLPFALMELVNRREFHEAFPFSLFLGMWVIQAVFFLALLPVIRKFRAAENARSRLVSLLLGVFVLVLMAWFWTALLLDQMPCFLGVQYCD